LGILQPNFEIADPRVTFSTIEEINHAGIALEKPQYLCFISPNIPATLLLINIAGEKVLKVADTACMECAHSRAECPISAFSLAGRRQLLPGWREIVNADKPTGERQTIPNFIAMLSRTLTQPLILPVLESDLIDYSEPVYTIKDIAKDIKVEI
jgi:hypothetical protein